MFENRNVQTPQHAAQILAFGDRSILGGKFADLSAAWDVKSAASPCEALRLLRNNFSPDLVLLMPADSLDPSLELCRNVKFDRNTRFTPVVAVRTARHESRLHDVLGAGVDDYVPDWISLRETQLRIDKCIRLKRATDLLEDSESVIVALAKAIEGKDECTCGHVDRVSAYCVELGQRLALPDDDLFALRTGGIVHDIGKVGIPDPILNKPGKLTAEEMTVMRRHPVIGFDILQPLRTFRNVLPIVRWHHERPNGTGYPDALAGDNLPLLPRIAAVADVFDALSTDRPYRHALPLETCRRIMFEEAALGNLDPQLVTLHFEIIGTTLPAIPIPIPA